MSDPAKPDSAVSIDVGVLESKLGGLLVKELLEQLGPMVEHVSEEVSSVRSQADGAQRTQRKQSLSVVVAIAVAVALGWNSYDETRDEQELRDGRIVASMKAYAERLDDYEERFDMLDESIAAYVEDRGTMRRVICQQHAKIQELYRLALGDKARPTACPFPDVVTSATP